MTATTSKLGADMTDAQWDKERLDAAIQDFALVVQMAQKPEHGGMRKELAQARQRIHDIARQPAAIDKQGATMRDRARRFLREFELQTGISMSDHVQEVMLNLFLRYAAPPANEASKPVAPEVTLTLQQFDAMRVALEVIAVGDSKTPSDTAAHGLVASGFWTDTLETSNNATPAAQPVKQDERGALTDRLATEAPATLMAIGRLLSEAGYAPELRIVEAVRAVIDVARAASTSADVAQGAEAVDQWQVRTRINGQWMDWVNCTEAECADYMVNGECQIRALVVAPIAPPAQAATIAKDSDEASQS